MSEQQHTPGPWPTPWTVDINRSMNRARIVASDGTQVISGMNIAKAEFITAAVNRDAAVARAIAKATGATP